jgi:hypothetical protein
MIRINLAIKAIVNLTKVFNKKRIFTYLILLRILIRHNLKMIDAPAGKYLKGKNINASTLFYSVIRIKREIGSDQINCPCPAFSYCQDRIRAIFTVHLLCIYCALTVH